MTSLGVLSQCCWVVVVWPPQFQADIVAIKALTHQGPLLLSTGGVWLCGDLLEECLQHTHCLQALHVHLCCHRSSALQGKVLLLHRQFQGHREGVHVSFKSMYHSFFAIACPDETFAVLYSRFCLLSLSPSPFLFQLKDKIGSWLTFLSTSSWNMVKDILHCFSF